MVIDTDSSITCLVMKTGKDRLGPGDGYSFGEFAGVLKNLTVLLCLRDRLVLQVSPECPHIIIIVRPQACWDKTVAVDESCVPKTVIRVHRDARRASRSVQEQVHPLG